MVQDYHLVCAQPEVISNFHRLHNGDQKAHVGKWAPANFNEAPDLTKRRTVLYTSQLNIPTWLQKILGAQILKLLLVGTLCNVLSSLSQMSNVTFGAVALHDKWCIELTTPTSAMHPLAAEHSYGRPIVHVLP